MYFYLDSLLLRKLGLMLWLHCQMGTSIPRHHPGPSSGLSGDADCPCPCGGSSWETTAPILVSSVKRTLVYCKQKGCCIYPAFPSSSGTRSKPFIRLLLTVGSSICPVAVPVPRGRTGLAAAGTLLPHSACPSHIHLVSPSGPKLLLQLHRHLSEIIKCPYSWRCLLRLGAGSFYVELPGLE